MRVTGARLVDPLRVPTLANLGSPLPAAHDPIHAAVLPGRTCERVLAIDVEDARIGDALLVHVYPVRKGGTATVLVGEEGRTRCFATLRPIVERAGGLTVDVEARGEELWADDLSVAPSGEVVAQRLAARRDGARLREGRIEVDGAHALSVEVESERIVARFSCDAPVALVARRVLRAHPWHRVHWEGSLDWYAEDPTKVSEQSLLTFRIGVERLLRYEDFEVRLDPWGGTIVVLCRGLDVLAAEHIFSTVVATVEALPAPTGARPAARPAPPFSAAAKSELLAVREAAVLGFQHARAYIDDGSRSLPERDDPFHASGPLNLCRLRTVVAVVDRPPDSPAESLTVILDDQPLGRLDVPSGTGTCRVSANVMLRYVEQRRVRVLICSNRSILWQRTVAVGLTCEIVLAELAVRIPDARRHGSAVVVERGHHPPATLRLSTISDEELESQAFAIRDPLVRFMRRVRGERSENPPSPAGSGEEPLDGEPWHLEVMLPGTSIEALSISALNTGGTIRPVDDGTLIACDIRSSDVAEILDTAMAIVSGGGIRPP